MEEQIGTQQDTVAGAIDGLGGVEGGLVTGDGETVNFPDDGPRPDTGLNTRQLRLVAALVSDTNIQAACQTADVSRAAAYQWMKQPAFQDELKRRRNAVLGEALANVKINATRAAAALVGLLDEDDPSLRRLVCRDILDRAIRIHDMEDIQTRLTAMEKVLKQQSGARP